MLRVVTDHEGRAEMRSALDEIVLDGARRMLAAALEAEVDAYIAELAEHLDEGGRRLVVRNGHAVARTITTAAGRVEVRAPRVNARRVDDSTGERCRFRSSILPPWCRKSPKVAEVLPLMYLHCRILNASPVSIDILVVKPGGTQSGRLATSTRRHAEA
jgi:putative transposase